MAVVDNPSFEVAENPGTYDQEGVPDSWVMTMGAAGGFEYAQLTSMCILGEDFETGWTANEGRRTIFGALELDDASFDVAIPEAMEDFEEEWGSNEDRRTVFAAGQLDDASFDTVAPEAMEDFEEEWSSNEDRRTVFGGGELDDASFDTVAPEAMEDFEEEWGSNEDRRTAFGVGELDDAAIHAGVFTYAFEMFETGIAVNVPAGVAVGTPTYIPPGSAYMISFSGTLTGELEIQVQREGFATWETRDTVTSVADAVNLSSGYQAVRIERTIVGGATSAFCGWQVLTEL